MDSYCKLPPSTSNEIFPLLIHTLKKHKGSISFELIYNKLLAAGRESEVWRFLVAFDSVDENLLLRCIKSCKLLPKDILPLIDRCDPKDINAADVTFSFPELSSAVYKALGDVSAPFVLPHLSEMDNETLQSMKTGNGSVVEIRISEQLHEKPSFITTSTANANSSNQQGSNTSLPISQSTSDKTSNQKSSPTSQSSLAPNASNNQTNPVSSFSNSKSDQLLVPNSNSSNFARVK